MRRADALAGQGCHVVPHSPLSSAFFSLSPCPCPCAGLAGAPPCPPGAEQEVEGSRTARTSSTGRTGPHSKSSATHRTGQHHATATGVLLELESRRVLRVRSACLGATATRAALQFGRGARGRGLWFLISRIPFPSLHFAFLSFPFLADRSSISSSLSSSLPAPAPAPAPDP